VGDVKVNIYKNCPLHKWAEKNKKYAPLILRLFLGVVFTLHGYQKLFVMGPSGVAGFFGSVGIPLASVMAWVVSLVEFFGGIAVILGLMVRHMSLLFSIIMLVAIFKVKFANGFSAYELDFVILGAALTLVLSGAGKLSIDEKCMK